MKWLGPFTIDDLLDSMLIPSHPRPPDDNSVYLISEKPWANTPTHSCIPLYVGSNTGKSKRFITRIGDLIADIFGFFSAHTGHHSGGQSLHEYCRKKQITPKKLNIGWIVECGCPRCLENQLYNEFQPSLNKKRPEKCKIHR